MRNVSDKSCRGNQNTFCVQKLFFKKNRTVYELMWKNKVQPDRPQLTIWHMRFACWIPKATNTHSQYVIFIAFTLQQWLQELASFLCYTYIACIVDRDIELNNIHITHCCFSIVKFLRERTAILGFTYIAYLVPLLLTYLLTYLLTPWCTVLLEKLTGLQLVKKFPTYYGTRRFITAFTSSLHLSLS